MILNAFSIGRIAQQVFSGVSEAHVWGITSRGVFLNIPSGWMVFLSSEDCRGPLTLNINGDVRPILDLTPGSPVRVRDGRILFKNSTHELRFDEAAPWQPPGLPGEALSQDERQRSLFSVVQQALKGNAGGLKSGLLRAVLFTLNEIGTMKNASKQSQALYKHPDVANLIQVLNQDEPAALGEALAPFIGRGGGLTPAGDDMLAGLLLALNRWGTVLYPGLEMRVQALNRAAVKSAQPKTTTLSANLIECAALGQADERLIFALDGIITGTPAPDACAQNLLTWGSSSGSDALAGITLAVLAIRQ